MRFETHAMARTCLSAVGVVLLLGSSATGVHAQSGKPTAPPATRPPAASSPATTAPATPDQKFTHVPDIVGLDYRDAMDALQRAGLLYNHFSNAAKPSAGAPRGAVLSVEPVPGTSVVHSTTIEARINARGADRTGRGKLGPNDVEHRMGWDLDEGKYEVIYGGADILLRRIEEAHPSTTGGATSYTRSIILEASDGATLAHLDIGSADVSHQGPATYLAYVWCTDLLGRPAERRTRVSVLSLNLSLSSQEGAACVRTSKGNIGVVHFRGVDYLGADPFKDAGDYVFQWALFLPDPWSPARVRR